jgi:hypothetical protein
MERLPKTLQDTVQKIKGTVDSYQEKKDFDTGKMALVRMAQLLCSQFRLERGDEVQEGDAKILLSTLYNQLIFFITIQ